MRRCHVRTLTVSCLALACSLPATATVKMTQTMEFHGYGPSHAGRAHATTTTLIQGDQSRTETSTEFEGKLLKHLTGTQVGVAITDVGRKLMLTLQPKNETYTELSFDQFLAQRDLLAQELATMRAQGVTSPQAEPTGPKMEFGPPQVTVTKAGSAKIAGYDANLLNVVVKMIGKYAESTETCEIDVEADLGFAKTPESAEVRAYYKKLAEGLGMSGSQMLAAGQSVLSAMTRYSEGFDKLFEEIGKQDGTPLRQNLRVKVRGACAGPGSDTASSGDDAAATSGGAMKKMFGKFKLGRKNKKEEPAEDKPGGAAGDAFTEVLAVDIETDSYEAVPAVDASQFRVPEGWKKVEVRGLPADDQ